MDYPSLSLFSSSMACHDRSFPLNRFCGYGMFLCPTPFFSSLEFLVSSLFFITPKKKACGLVLAGPFPRCWFHFSLSFISLPFS